MFILNYFDQVICIGSFYLKSEKKAREKKRLKILYMCTEVYIGLIHKTKVLNDKNSVVRQRQQY